MLGNFFRKRFSNFQTINDHLSFRAWPALRFIKRFAVEGQNFTEHWSVPPTKCSAMWEKKLKKMISPLYISKIFENANSLSLRDIFTAGTRFFWKHQNHFFRDTSSTFGQLPKTHIQFLLFTPDALPKIYLFSKKNSRLGPIFFPRYFPYKI